MWWRHLVNENDHENFSASIKPHHKPNECSYLPKFLTAVIVVISDCSAGILNSGILDGFPVLKSQDWAALWLMIAIPGS